ncbi:SF1B family DNA helicase RecD2 [Lactococcus termiticola]|uniref:ATP-dependent RecD2 DNA helicase n=1 Tax=Lactococcus termiticola TaxID=2169526 RepID=A0A2R5HDQ1_9LACT|nr:ATP-dependent RecD-like DNA helicase [Lactococcus termiticola]GBG95936.1 exodeoxyribonuclease V subunit alpha [Lactococcus termiticola]
MNPEQVSFTGRIEAIFFSNPSNFYKVLLLEIEDTDTDYGDSEIVVTGTIAEVTEGESYSFKGRLTTHAKYGEQLAVESYEKAVPTSAGGLIKYFSSDKFSGVGAKTAQKIVELYPVDTVDQLLDHPESLESIMTPAKAKSFMKVLKENHGMEKIFSSLAEFGISSRLTFEIYELYKEESLEKVRSNPYQLVEDIKGIGFKTADKIAEELGIASDSPERFRAALLHVVESQSAETGDTYIEAKELLEKAIQLLLEARQSQVAPDALATELKGLIDDGLVQQEGRKIFENSLYFAESGIANSLMKMLDRKGDDFSEAEILEAIEEVEADFDMSYADQQKAAIVQAIQSQFSILTGGPGTGKTTIIRGFIEVYAKLYKVDLDESHYTDDLFPILLAAPTGRASRRMNEMTGLSAATLHRHLGLTQEDEPGDDFSNDLSGSLLIVDEFSMVDTWLANKLFQAIAPSMKVLLVGDSDQLPSVGPGQVFADLLKIPKIPAVRLDKIFRQGDDSTIVDLAHSIKEGQLPADFKKRKPDRSYFEARGPQVAKLVEQIASAWIRRGNDPFELQLLAPMYKGNAGIDALNKLLQELFNPKDDDALEFVYRDKNYRLGDKVLHLVNDAVSNVFNGDLGQIKELIPAKHSESKQDEIVMDFDGEEVVYPRAEWYKITLAYAMSIHKAQGSEFSSVIIPMVSSYSRMLERNLLYTGITRAKQSLILIGEETAFRQAVQKEGANRKTYLLERFPEMEISVEPAVSTDLSLEMEEVQEEREPILSPQMIDSGDFDPMIGITEVDLAIFK